MTIKTVESAPEEFIIWYANNIDRTSDRALIRAKVTELLKQRDTALIEAAVEAMEKKKFNHPDGSCYQCQCKTYDAGIDDAITALQEFNQSK